MLPTCEQLLLSCFNKYKVALISDCFGLMQEGERAKEKEPIMNRILKNVAAWH